ncbi:ACT domain-containing protein, partial [Paracoccus simplex]
MKKYTLTVACPSTRGIVATVAGFLAEHGCNITDSSQFDDTETGKFFMRVSFVSEEGVGLEDLREGLAEPAKPFAMDYAIHDESEKMKVVIMVSRFGHCLNDLLYRWRIGALPIEIVAVISNH